ncbi:hypothetical protein ABMA77_00700 [Halobacteriovorax sp. RZ-1]|uniref:trypsin-like peptidase domain-containing protein n=1 Tax=unclassified Halobacteriovorax TaxID=2639665 RepID=UPI00371C00AF
MKSLLRILVILSLTFMTYAEECDYNNSISPDLEKVLKLAGQVEDIVRYIHDTPHEGDDRKERTASSPKWLAAVGKLNNHCSANIIGNDLDENSRVVSTAFHCIDEYIESGRPIKITFITNDGRTIQRVAKIHKKGDLYEDRAILILDELISYKDIPPLVIGDGSMINEDDTKLTIAGYSADTGLGAQGKKLTYDADCVFGGKGSDKTENHIYFDDCSAYGGASGGAAVLEVDEDGEKVPYLIGHIDESTKKGVAVAYGYYDTYYSEDNFLNELYDAVDEFNTYDD